jgi:hypothetical protein
MMGKKSRDKVKNEFDDKIVLGQYNELITKTISLEVA